jgi:dihydrofolate reductase
LSGAIITGRRTFDIAGGWGGRHPVGAPFFVLTHTVPDEHVGPGIDGTAVTDGIESALEQARAVAGDGDIAVGVADVARPYLQAGLLEEIPCQRRVDTPRRRCGSIRRPRGSPL